MSEKAKKTKNIVLKDRKIILFAFESTNNWTTINLMNDCREEEHCSEPGFWPFAPRVCVCVCVRVCVWMSVSEVSHWVGFARKETDSYRDSGLARPKGGKQGEMGVYGGLVN